MNNFYKQSFLPYVKAHKVRSGFYVLILICIVYMYQEGTITYPYIMADRQVQSLRLCTFGDHHEFDAKEFGFNISVPEKFCILPNRQYPKDGSFQLIPKDFYFSFNEYAFGSVVEVSQGYVMTEERNQRRSVEGVLGAFMGGQFINNGKISTSTNKNGLHITRVDHVSDVFYTGFYDWVLVDSPDNAYFFSGYVPEKVDHTVFNYMVDNLKAD